MAYQEIDIGFFEASLNMLWGIWAISISQPLPIPSQASFAAFKFSHFI